MAFDVSDLNNLGRIDYPSDKGVDVDIDDLDDITRIASSSIFSFEPISPSSGPSRNLSMSGSLRTSSSFSRLSFLNSPSLSSPSMKEFSLEENNEYSPSPEVLSSRAASAQPFLSFTSSEILSTDSSFFKLADQEGEILVIEDSPINSKILIKTLNGLVPKMKVFHVTNGTDAMTKCQDAFFRLILCDHDLIDSMNGDEVLTSIRALPKHLYTPTVSISDHREDEFVRRRKEPKFIYKIEPNLSGNDRSLVKMSLTITPGMKEIHMAKPFNKTMLVNVLTTYLQNPHSA